MPLHGPAWDEDRLPPSSSDERILACLSGVPLVRIAAADGSSLQPGPDDPGGRGWRWRQAMALGATLLLFRQVRHVLRGSLAVWPTMEDLRDWPVIEA